MKKWINRLIVGLSTTSMLTPMVLTSCSSENFEEYAKIVAELKETAIKEFKEICKIPHPSGKLTQIVEYLINRITELGYQPNSDTSNNVWFDIPATPGCENWKKIIIQGHSDMVYAGTDDEAPIIPVEEIKDGQHIMHSQDYKTSLGADDGIGIATMFAICQNKDLSHGPIRFLITSNEEIGCIGAHRLDSRVLDADYLLNVDGEIDCGLAVACYGTSDWGFLHSFTPGEITMPNVFELRVSGLHGGHSGEDVGYGYANAERLAFEIVRELNRGETTNDEENNVQLIEINHHNESGEEIQYQSNALIRNANLVFATNLDEQGVKDAIDKLNDDFKAKYYGEKWDDKTTGVNIEVKSADKPSKAFSLDDSNKILRLMGDNDEGFYCGLIGEPLDKEKHVPGASCNIGPTELNANGKDADKFATHTLGRSYLQEDILVFSEAAAPTEQTNVQRSFREVWFNILGEGAAISRDISTKLAWESTVSNPIRDLLVDGYRKVAKREPNLVTLYGALEESEFTKKKPSMLMVTIGPKIANCHTQDETLYLDTMDAEYSAIIYALQHYNQVK